MRILESGGRLVLAIAALSQAPPTPPFDIIVRHGTVVDGSGGPAYTADLAISGGSIARIGNLGDAKAVLEIDANGLYVSPGFINIHSHANPTGLARAANMLTQGVTTEILNGDGSGPVDIHAQLARLSSPGLAVNIGAQIGFNAIWSAVMGPSDRRPTADEIGRMRALLTAGLEAGAWGVSAGLDYKPAYFAKTDEVVQVVEVARPWRTNFINHVRQTPETDFSARAGHHETIAIAERTGLAAVITHIKVPGSERGTADQTLAQMREATARGVYTAADAYPYLAGQTQLFALIIPGWAQDGGREAMLKRFADPVLRQRIVREAEDTMAKRFTGVDSIYLPQTRQKLTAVMSEMQVSAGEAVVRLVERENPRMIAWFGIEEDLVELLRHPTTSIACDCGAADRNVTHPRYLGTYPRVLGRYVRELKTLTWEDAIRKMSGLPAATIGMVDRGLIAVGMAADLTVFDPRTVIDRATFDEPALTSQGVRWVLVNGRVAVRDGAPTGEQGGRTLRRTARMPTRPMTGDAPQPIVRRATAEQVEIAVDVAQRGGESRARGTFLLTDRSSGVAIDMKEFGRLQTTRTWASFTGRASLRANEPEQSVIVITDGDDVLVSAGEYAVKAAIRR